MRRLVSTAALLVLLALPLWAQRRGSAAPRGGFVGGAPARHLMVRPGWGTGVRGGFAFGHNPRFGVFFGTRPFRHHRHFFRTYAPYVYPYYPVYPYAIYPYYPLGLQSDLIYSNAYSQAVQPAYMADHDTGLQNEVYQLQAEVDQLRRQQAAQAERQQYALNTPTETPRPIPAARPRPEPPAPPTVLVLKDGRREEVHNYAIAGQTLWIFSEERARKIPLADLDVAATRQANEERGLEFSLGPIRSADSAR